LAIEHPVALLTTPPNMKLPLISYGLLAWLTAQASATALTYKLGANEQACFYTATKTKGEKIAFYFAVRMHSCCYYWET
jgi:hypothetical protein